MRSARLAEGIGADRSDKRLPQVDELIGDYRVDSELGRGGLGVVYLAMNQHLQSQRVAIKVLTRSSLGPATDLLREADHLCRLDHPNVVRMLHYGIHREHPYLVLEYLGEQTLHRQLLERGPLSLIETLRVGVAIAQALEYLHGQNVVHCDIKPQNIVITEAGRPKLIDFGFARSLHSTSSEPFGTLTFAAPEPARTEKSDVFSAAMTLLACLAPTPAGHAPDLRIVSGLAIPHALERLMERAASRDPEDRPLAPTWRSQLEQIHRKEQRPFDRRPRLSTAALIALSMASLPGDGWIQATPAAASTPDPVNPPMPDGASADAPTPYPARAPVPVPARSPVVTPPRPPIEKKPPNATRAIQASIPACPDLVLIRIEGEGPHVFACKCDGKISTVRAYGRTEHQARLNAQTDQEPCDKS